MNSNWVFRIRFISIAVVLFAVILVGKLYLVQIVRGDQYFEKADRQYVNPEKTTLDRGAIYFETKDGQTVGAATVKEGFTLSINPKLLENAEEAYTAISAITEIDKKSFLEKAAKKADPYEEIKKKVDRDQGLAIDALRIPGVGIYKETWRSYPGDSLASHTIGLIGLDKDNNLAGRYGLERYYEETLTRSNEGMYKNFFAEIFSGIQDTISGKPQQGDIVTTIEPSVEEYLETTLKKTLEKWESNSIGGIIINPKTGEIYALGSLPSFNPNDTKSVKDPRVFSNPLIENVYEMGSIIKPLTVAAGIDSGAITANSKYNDVGIMTLNSKQIGNFDGKARGYVDMQEVLNQSLNLGVTHIMLQMGRGKLSEYFYNFGLGEKTGIDQPNEQKGIVETSLNSPRDIEHATASFGQGIAMSPIATVRALSALANGGTIVRPHLVKKINYDIGTSDTIVIDEGRRVLKKETTDEVTRMLVKVVDTALKKGEVKMKNYSIAAKTGTAQIADRSTGGYYKDRYLHSFFGYFPAYDPQFLVFLYQVEPKGAQFASETLTDPFIDIAKFLIAYYQVTPDR